jgi:hypothetical protein
MIVKVPVLEECTVIYILRNSRGIEVPTAFPEETQNVIRTYVRNLLKSLNINCLICTDHKRN